MWRRAGYVYCESGRSGPSGRLGIANLVGDLGSAGGSVLGIGSKLRFGNSVTLIGGTGPSDREKSGPSGRSAGYKPVLRI